MINPIGRSKQSLLSVVTLLLTASAAHAQCDPANLFGPDQQFATDGGTFVAIGDLDGDGIPDLVVANTGSDSVSVLLGNGDGTFQPRQDFDTGRAPISISIGDLDGDGIPDLAIANLLADTFLLTDRISTVSVLLGNGDGTFQPRQNFVVGDFPYSITIGDLDGDGVPDLAVASRGPNTVSVLLGNGDGTFQPRQDYDAGTEPFFVAIGDLNSDGVPDLAVANGDSNTVSVLFGNGDGTFQPRQDIATGSNPNSIAIGDLDGDGVPDLAVATRGDVDGAASTISVMLGNGDGTFQPHREFTTGNNAQAVVIGDLDGDGVPDLAVANNTSGTVSVLLGNGDGSFQPRLDFVTGNGPWWVAIGDLDGDGAFDLVVPNTLSGSVSVLLNKCPPPPPQIVQQPEGVVAGPEPQLVAFSVVAASPLPASYQWLRDGVPLIDDSQISGALTPTLTILADTADVAAYRCVVSNPNGQTISRRAVLSFRPNPCPADLNTDGSVDYFDIVTYLNLFKAGCP